MIIIPVLQMRNWSRVGFTIKLRVLVRSGCYNKIPQIGGL